VAIILKATSQFPTPFPTLDLNINFFYGMSRAMSEALTVLIFLRLDEFEYAKGN